MICVLSCTTFAIFLFPMNIPTFLARLNLRSVLPHCFCCQIRKDKSRPHDCWLHGSTSLAITSPDDISWGGETIILYYSTHLKWKWMLTSLWYVYPLVYMFGQCPGFLLRMSYWRRCQTHLGIRVRIDASIKKKSCKFCFERSYFLENEKYIFSSTQIPLSKYSFAIVLNMEQQDRNLNLCSCNL